MREIKNTAQRRCALFFCDARLDGSPIPSVSRWRVNWAWSMVASFKWNPYQGSTSLRSTLLFSFFRCYDYYYYCTGRPAVLPFVASYACSITIPFCRNRNGEPPTTTTSTGSHLVAGAWGTPCFRKERAFFHLRVSWTGTLPSSLWRRLASCKSYIHVLNDSLMRERVTWSRSR